MHPSDWKVQASQCRLTSSDVICSCQLCQFWAFESFQLFSRFEQLPNNLAMAWGGVRVFSFFVAVLKSVRRCVC